MQASLVASPSSAAPLAALPAWVDTQLHPFTPRRLRLPEGDLAYLDEGDGPTVLLVHGTPGWSFEWRHVIAGLRSGCRVITVDHLGFGLSEKVRDPAILRPEDHARRLRAFMEALDLQEVTLVVHDFGGPIGLGAALAAPERIAGVVVANSWCWAHGDDRRIASMSRLVRSPLGRLFYLWLNASPRWIVPMAFGDRRRLTRRVHRQYLAPIGTRRDRLGPWVLGCELAGSDPWYASLWDRRGELARWPLSLVWGLADPAFGPAYLQRWREAFPQAPVTRLEGVGHWPQEEAPEALVDAVRAQLGR